MVYGRITNFPSCITRRLLCHLIMNCDQNKTLSSYEAHICVENLHQIRGDEAIKCNQLTRLAWFPRSHTILQYFLCLIRVQLFSCYFRDFLFERVHLQKFCSPVPHFNTYLLVQESFPRSKSAIETRTMKPKKKSKFRMFVNQPEKASTDRQSLFHSVAA